MKERRYCVTGTESGTPMKDYLVNGQRPLSEEECIKRFEPLIRELGEAHAEGERGLSVCPDNLLVRPDDTVVWVQPTNGNDTGKSIHHGFSPIEQYNDKAEAGTWTDVYTMCATLLYCIKGKIPPSPIERMSGSDINLDGISAAVAAVLKKGLEIRAEDRIQTFGELTAGLYGRADAADVTAVKGISAKYTPAAGISWAPDSDRTVFHAAPEKDNRTVLITQEDTDGKTEYRPVESAKKQTVQQQFEIGAAVQAKAAAEKAAVPEKEISEQTPREDERDGHKKKKVWKTVAPLAVLAVVAAASFFAFKDRWSDPAVRDPLPSDVPAQVQQTMQPVATDTPPVATDTPPVAADTPPVAADTPPVAADAQPVATDAPPVATDAPPVATDAPPVEEAIPTMDIKQLVPAAEEAAVESPEPEITFAETKPQIPEASTSEPNSAATIEQVLDELGVKPFADGNNQGTQAVQSSNTASTPGAVPSAAGKRTAEEDNGNNTPAEQTTAFNNAASDENKDNAPVAQKNDTPPMQTSPGDAGAAANGQTTRVANPPANTTPGDTAEDTNGQTKPTANPPANTTPGDTAEDTNGQTTPAAEDTNNIPPEQSDLTEDGLKALTGQYGETEYMRGGANPYYLDKPVVNCDHVRMDLSFEQISGSGYGYFYLYVKDLDGNWHHVALFRIEKEQADGKTVTYELDLDGIESFVAIAICPEEKGMDFVRRYDMTFYVDPDCVSEYGADISRPSFTPAGSDSPVSSTHAQGVRWDSDSEADPFGSIMDGLMGDDMGKYGYDGNGVSAWSQYFGSDGTVCFVAGTPIHTEAGLKPIEEIRQGDLVWSWNDTTSEAELKPVVETYINPSMRLAYLTICGETITCTPEHRFYVPQKGWTRAYALHEGDELVLLSGKTVRLDSIRFEQLESPVDVYNFQVLDTHSYYVGESGIRVHNADPGVGATESGWASSSVNSKSVNSNYC